MILIRYVFFYTMASAVFTNHPSHNEEQTKENVGDNALVLPLRVNETVSSRVSLAIVRIPMKRRPSIWVPTSSNDYYRSDTSMQDSKQAKKAQTSHPFVSENLVSSTTHDDQISKRESPQNEVSLGENGKKLEVRDDYTNLRTRIDNLAIILDHISSERRARGATWTLFRTAIEEIARLSTIPFPNDDPDINRLRFQIQRLQLRARLLFKNNLS